MRSEGYQWIDFKEIEGVPCPCGTARRALMEVESVPYSLHLTSISENAQAHYHRRITETYFFLECQPDAQIELEGVAYPVQPQSAITIFPGTRHRALGKMKVVIVASPKFDPTDEWLD